MFAFPHSYLSAAIGSTFAAWRAGMYDASMVASTSNNVTLTSVTGSFGPISNNSERMVRVSRNDPTRPIPTPATDVINPCNNTIFGILVVLAPSASALRSRVSSER